MPKQQYEGKGTDLASALGGLYKTVFGEKAPQQGEEMRYRVDLILPGGKTRYSSGPMERYEDALDEVKSMATSLDPTLLTLEVTVTAKYEAPQQAKPSGAAPSRRRTTDITGLF